MHGVRGAPGDVRVRGPGFPSDLRPRAPPLAPLVHPPESPSREISRVKHLTLHSCGPPPPRGLRLPLLSRTGRPPRPMRPRGFRAAAARPAERRAGGFPPGFCLGSWPHFADCAKAGKQLASLGARGAGTRHSHTMEEVARALVAAGKGILASDESTGTMGRRLTAAGLPDTAVRRPPARGVAPPPPGAAGLWSTTSALVVLRQGLRALGPRPTDRRSPRDSALPASRRSAAPHRPSPTGAAAVALVRAGGGGGKAG